MRAYLPNQIVRPVTAAVLFLILLGSFQVSKCSAQTTDGLDNRKQLSADFKDAASTGDLGGIAENTGAIANSSAGEPTKGSHSVKLSWNPSVASTKSARDLIIGYIVYRSTKPHDHKASPINYTRIAGTTFVDTHVELGKTYYYVTRAVNASGVISRPSNEVKAEIPR